MPNSPSYGVHILQLIRFERVCLNVSDFNSRIQLLFAKKPKTVLLIAYKTS